MCPGFNLRQQKRPCSGTDTGIQAKRLFTIRECNSSVIIMWEVKEDGKRKSVRVGPAIRQSCLFYVKI